MATEGFLNGLLGPRTAITGRGGPHARRSDTCHCIVCRMPTPDSQIPTQIRQEDPRTLSIIWADGAQSLLDVRALRLACGCANCVDEWSGEALLAPASVPEDVTPVGIRSVGRYAIQIEWSDGHATGIYPFERLRKLADEGSLSALH